MTFYEAFNSANGRGSDEDEIYTKTLPVSEDIATGLSGALLSSSLILYPNSGKTSFEISSDKTIENVRIFDEW